MEGQRIQVELYQSLRCQLILQIDLLTVNTAMPADCLTLDIIEYSYEDSCQLW